MLRHAHNIATTKGSVWLLCLWSLLLFSACSCVDRQQVDRLNDASYAYHYRNLDSAEVYARRAYGLSGKYGDGKAEAINNLAFVHIMRMEYVYASESQTTEAFMTAGRVPGRGCSESTKSEASWIRACSAVCCMPR